jgi:MFS family permease|tara:strand:+ start:991 stop:2253 length:1263 start_codon:yes stop_codon:yes gene_type:complete
MANQSQHKRELLAWAFLPMMMGAVDGGVIGILTKRLFDGHVSETLLDWVVATLAAAQGFANISSFLWSAMSNGRHKIRFITALKIAIVLMITGVAFVPQTGLGLLLLLLCVVGTRVCYTGIVTLRTTVWQANYPRENRALVAGKIATVQALVLASVAFGVGQAMDMNEQSFRWVYPIAASFGILGAWIYSKIRVENHTLLLKNERTESRHVSFLPWKTFRLLLEDRPFAKYMGCQFIFGIGNLMLMAPLIVILNDQFQLDYLGEICIVTIVPILMIPISTPFWATLLNKTHVLTFRSIHSWFFVVSSLCIGFSIATHFLAGLWIGAVIRGVGFGGGVLAWNLGHQDYAPIEQSGRYMGLHVTLTGIRGLLAPAIGMGLYTFLIKLDAPAGSIVFFVGAFLSAIGGLGFICLAKTRVKQNL